jgi:hypothetical protein
MWYNNILSKEVDLWTTIKIKYEEKLLVVILLILKIILPQKRNQM